MSTIIESRRSIRKYQADKQVSKENLDSMMRAAMLSPSARNLRPWEFIAITKRETLDEIAQIMPNASMCKTATAAIVVVGAPNDDTSEAFFPQDCGAATQNILLEAVSMGLGTCWCGVYPKKERMAHLIKLLGIQEHKIPFNVIAIGYPDESPEQRGFYDENIVTYIE